VAPRAYLDEARGTRRRLVNAAHRGEQIVYMLGLGVVDGEVNEHEMSGA
jgi:hypothetical protein